MTSDDRDAALARLRTTTDVADVAGSDLVIEAIVEDLDAKRELFAELDRICPPSRRHPRDEHERDLGAEIAEATEHPERVLGMHFFNPAPLLPLVEIVRTKQPADDVVETAEAWAASAGKKSVVCNDTPGFIVNRILIPLLNDCVHARRSPASPRKPSIRR